MFIERFVKAQKEYTYPYLRKSDIRGIDLYRINLYQAEFDGTHAGLSTLSKAIQAVGLFFVALLSGVLTAFLAIWATGLLSSSNIAKYTFFPGVVVASLVLVVLLVVMQKGFVAATGLGTTLLVTLGILAVLVQNYSVNSVLLFASLAIIQELLALWLISLVVCATRSYANRIAFSLLAIAAWLGVSLTLALANHPDAQVQVDLLDIIVVLCTLSTGILIGSNAFKVNSKFSRIAQLAVSLTAIGGTSFREANLAEANFSRAILKHTDFRDANLMRTRWYGAKGLDFARLGNTYLASPKIRQLVVTCNGKEKNFDDLDLTGVNLQGAELQDASFIGAKLNQSNLRDVDLSRAILKQTQLDGADLTGATLTGACIEDWGMTSTTNLENVQCGYVYMRLSTPEKRNPLRKPDDERKTFSEGEFADFIKPYFDTLDLYHRQDVDPRSISIALKDLAENHPDADLQFVAIEWRGNGLNIRYTAAPDVDKSDLNHEYFTNYARIRKELLGSIQLRLAAQDAEINRMEGVINKFIEAGTHQSTVQAENIQVIQGKFLMTENRGIHIKTGDNANVSGLSSGEGIVNLGNISGNITNAINQLPDSSEPAQENLKTLLAQLQQVIEIDSNLTDPDKADLLEQVQLLAEAKQVEEPEKREGIARKALKMFDATLKSLPDTAKIVDACSKLLPLILKALGFSA